MRLSADLRIGRRRLWLVGRIASSIRWVPTVSRSPRDPGRGSAVEPHGGWRGVVVLELGRKEADTSAGCVASTFSRLAATSRWIVASHPRPSVVASQFIHNGMRICLPIQLRTRLHGLSARYTGRFRSSQSSLGWQRLRLRYLPGGNRGIRPPAPPSKSWIA